MQLGEELDNLWNYPLKELPPDMNTTPTI